MKKVLAVLALSSVALAFIAFGAQTSATSYWDITNDAHRIITITSDKEAVEIKPGETKRVYRIASFEFTVKHVGMHGGTTHVNKFTSESSSLTIYSRQLGKLGIRENS